MIKCKLDSDRLVKELELLKVKNREVYDILLDIEDRLLNTHHIMDGCIVTHIFRLLAEQDTFYANNAKYKIKKFISPHQLWHGVDLSTKHLSRDIIDDLVQYINGKYNSLNYYKTTVLYHQVESFGLHFHIQFVLK